MFLTIYLKQGRKHVLFGTIDMELNTTNFSMKKNNIKKKQSAFTLWVEAQFGKRPQMGNRTDNEIDEFILLGRQATIIQDQQVLWESTRDAALKAWIAKDVSEDEILRRIK